MSEMKLGQVLDLSEPFRGMELILTTHGYGS